VYSPGDHFSYHRDAVHSPGQFASLVLDLPSIYTAGSVDVQCGTELTNIAHNKHDRSCHAFWSLFYADCLHRVHVLESGYRTCITFDVCLEPALELNKLPTFDAEVAKVFNKEHHDEIESIALALKEWHESIPVVDWATHKKALFPLKGGYSDNPKVWSFEKESLVLVLDHLLPHGEVQTYMNAREIRSNLLAFRGRDRVRMQALLEALESPGISDLFHISTGKCYKDSNQRDDEKELVQMSADCLFGNELPLDASTVFTLNGGGEKCIFFYEADTGNEGFQQTSRYEFCAIWIIPKKFRVSLVLRMACLDYETLLQSLLCKELTEREVLDVVLKIDFHEVSDKIDRSHCVYNRHETAEKKNKFFNQLMDHLGERCGGYDKLFASKLFAADHSVLQSLVDFNNAQRDEFVAMSGRLQVHPDEVQRFLAVMNICGAFPSTEHWKRLSLVVSSDIVHRLQRAILYQRLQPANAKDPFNIVGVMFEMNHPKCEEDVLALYRAFKGARSLLEWMKELFIEHQPADATADATLIVNDFLAQLRSMQQSPLGIDQAMAKVCAGFIHKYSTAGSALFHATVTCSGIIMDDPKALDVAIWYWLKKKSLGSRDDKPEQGTLVMKSMVDVYCARHENLTLDAAFNPHLDFQPLYFTYQGIVDDPLPTAIMEFIESGKAEADVTILSPLMSTNQPSHSWHTHFSLTLRHIKNNSDEQTSVFKVSRNLRDYQSTVKRLSEEDKTNVKWLTNPARVWL